MIPRQERPVIVGILNLTPDSFSDGGAYADADSAVLHACRIAAEGADIIDVGGESTRPGAAPVAAAEQIRRTGEVIRRLRQALPDQVAISIDTTLVEVAAAALETGATIINDISAGRDDPGMFALAAERKVALVLMHMQGTSITMQTDPHYQDVVGEVRAFLIERASLAETAGVERERIIIDPGIGFGKTKDHNLALLADLGAFAATGYAVLLGASRKRFMGGAEQTPRELVGATCATTALGVAAGVRYFRVHDVKANRQAADVAWAIMRGQ
ncbi:MAG: dihydropteroate synthase [Chromatiales bacterium]